MSATSNFPVVFRVVDILPQNDSAETNQNSEPSIAVNPVNPAQMFAGSFGDGVPPFFVSTDGGTTWSIFGTLFNNDKSIAWKVDGSAVLVATMIGMPDFGPINTYSAFTQLNNYVGSNRNDQPWIRTGPSNHVYVAFNDLGQFGPGNGRTASVNVSTDGGSNYTTVRLDRVGGSAPGAAQDDPAVRVAVNGSRVYAVFDRCLELSIGTPPRARFSHEEPEAGNLKDKVAQRAIVMVLEAVFEQDFLGPARSRTAQTAIASIQTSWSCAPTMAEWTASLPWGRVEAGSQPPLTSACSPTHKTRF